MTSYAFLTKTTVHAIIVLVVASFLCPATGQTTTVTEDQLAKRSLDNKLSLFTQQEALNRIVTIRTTLISKAKRTQDLLEKMASMSADYESNMSSLLHSDEGKKIVKDPSAFLTYFDLHQFPVISSHEIAERLSQASSLLSTAQLGANPPEVGYLPSQETHDKIYELLPWAETTFKRFSEDYATLNTLTRNLPKTVDVSNVKTLNDALEKHKARLKEFLSSLYDDVTAISQDQARTDLLGNFVEAEIRQLKAEQDRVIALKDAKIASIRHDYEVQLLEQEEIRARERFEADKKYQDALAENKRLRLIADAERKAKDTQAEIKTQKIIQDADYAKKLALAKSIEVRQLLAPFMAKGYYQPGLGSGTYERSPISLNALKNQGALRPTVTGLKALLRIGITKGDKERPRWSFGRSYSFLKPKEIDQLRQAQQYLIDLGDIMVQEDLLAQ